MSTRTHSEFHLRQDTQTAAPKNGDTEFTYSFENFFHPFVEELTERLNQAKSLSDLFDPTWQAGQVAPFFDSAYKLVHAPNVTVEYFPKEFDVSLRGPYANYNWELFFHVPLTIAVHLSKNHRFAEAQRWFHFIFDPTCNDPAIAEPRERYWKFLPFRRKDLTESIDHIVRLLSVPEDGLTQEEKVRQQDASAGYGDLLKDPFRPHAVARTRHVAYQYCVVMKYLDNLIAWGDTLFRQDTLESLNEATQIYILAANILGRKPQRVPPAGTTRPRTFADLKQRGLGQIGNALVELEGKFPLNRGLPHINGKDPGAKAALFGIGRSLYFCIPRNEKLLSYWDTVADRLFKIRHCMNIEGVARQLALFDPPIDPGMLVKAAAAGINIGSIVSGLNQPASPVRSLFFMQKALELANEVRGLGNALLAALEKGDAEGLGRLRQRHEISLQQKTKEVRFLQWKQAQETTNSLLASRKAALDRLRYYQLLLDLPADPNALELDRIELELTEDTFDTDYKTLVGQYDKLVKTEAFQRLAFPPETQPAEGQSTLHLTTTETNEFHHLGLAQECRTVASGLQALAALFTPVPDVNQKAAYWGLGFEIQPKTGTALVNSTRLIGEMIAMIGSLSQHNAESEAKTAAYERRANEWLLQHNLAAHELMQNGRQILASLLAEQVARHEYSTIQHSIEQAQEVDQFLESKYTNEDLHKWMQGELSRLYYEYYRFAFDTARKAERTMKQELMRPEVDATDYIKFNYCDAGRKGLLSGEALYLDVKRMEMAYHENNKREYELTKSVSLRQLNPTALLTLKATGTCEVSLEEWLFDLDTPGHYLRRIKTVGLSVPSVAGPYTSVNCTLSLLKSCVRKSASLPDNEEYARQPDEDARFVDYLGAVQSVVTSSANNDSGLFETNLRDERFLPFEGAGAIGTWRLELPAAFRQFDYDTISDVILHLRYTARQGGAQLRDKAIERLNQVVASLKDSNLLLFFSLRHDFPTEWQRFVAGTGDFKATVTWDHFPYLAQRRNVSIVQEGIAIHAIQDHRLESTAAGLSTGDFSSALAARGAFDLSLRVPDKDAAVFLTIPYTLEAP